MEICLNVKPHFTQSSRVAFLCDLWIYSTFRHNDYYQAFDFYQNITPASACGLSTSLIGLFFLHSFLHETTSKKVIILLGIHAVCFACLAIGIHAVYFACLAIGIHAVYFACLLFTTCLCSHFRRLVVILWRAHSPATHYHMGDTWYTHMVHNNKRITWYTYMVYGTHGARVLS